MTFGIALLVLGQVVFGGLPVPGATVTASRGDVRVAVATDEQGIYRFPDLEEGVWTFDVEMLGFAAATREVTVAAKAPRPFLSPGPPARACPSTSAIPGHPGPGARHGPRSHSRRRR